MGIVFFCQSCGARFEVDPRNAGKKGRCKKCGQNVVIPRAEQIASMVAMPALAASAVGSAPVPAAGPGQGRPSLSSWLGGEASSVGLAPLTVDRMPISIKRGSAPTPLDDEDTDSKPYVLATPELALPYGRSSGRPNTLVWFWRRALGKTQRLFRWLNESAYLVSVPFLMILLLGVAVKSYPLALLGATVVVLLNIGRIVAGVANLAVVPFRDGLNLQKMKKPFRRVAEPLLTIGLVVLAFTFIPWLSGGHTGEGSIADRVRSGAERLEGEMKGEVKTAVAKAKALDVERLESEARARLKTIGSGPGDDPAQAGAEHRSPAAAVGGLIKDVGQRVRATVDEAQKQP